jgi:hypothetical protein
MEEYISCVGDRLYRRAIKLCGEDLGIQLSTVYSTRVKMCGKLFTVCLIVCRNIGKATTDDLLDIIE